MRGVRDAQQRAAPPMSSSCWTAVKFHQLVPGGGIREQRERIEVASEQGGYGRGKEGRTCSKEGRSRPLRFFSNATDAAPRRAGPLLLALSSPLLLLRPRLLHCLCSFAHPTLLQQRSESTVISLSWAAEGRRSQGSKISSRIKNLSFILATRRCCAGDYRLDGNDGDTVVVCRYCRRR